MNMHPTPVAFSFLITENNLVDSFRDRGAVGSSKIITFAELTSARAINTNCFSAKEEHKCRYFH